MRVLRQILVVGVFQSIILSQLAPPVFAGIEIAVSTGTASPDGNGQLSLFDAPAINESGQLVFVAEVANTSGGTADNLAMFRRDAADLTLITRTGSMFTEKPIVGFFPSTAAISANGSVAGNVVLGPSTTFLAFLGDGSAMTPLVAPGSASPSGDNTLLGMNHSAINDAGVAVFQAAYIGDNPEAGLYQRSANGNLTTRLLQQSVAPRGGIVEGFGPRFVINEANQIGALLTIDLGGDVTHSASRIDGSAIHELVREGDLALDGITTIQRFGTGSSSSATPTPMINDVGQIAFSATYAQAAAERLGIFVADDAGATLVAPGNSLPGGSSLQDVRVIGLSDSGQVGFWAEFFGGVDRVSGIYVADSSGSALVALEDAETPVPGKYFHTFRLGSSAQNAVGQVAFFAELSDTANGDISGRGVFFYDPEDGLKQIIRTGDALDGSTVTRLFFWGTVNQAFQCPDSSLTGLNRIGQVAFSYDLANGESGIAIWSADRLSGDYNQDGAVDAADYTVWRDNLGSPDALANDDTPGVDSDDYDRWKANFGVSAGTGADAASFSPVPEAATLTLALLGMSLVHATGRKRFIAASRLALSTP